MILSTGAVSIVSCSSLLPQDSKETQTQRAPSGLFWVPKGYNLNADLTPIPHNSKIIKLIHSDTQSISFEYSHLSECPEKCSLKDLTKCWLGTVSGTFSFIIHLYLWQKRGKFVCCSIKITEGKIKVTPHAAGKLAWFRDAGLILCCLTIYPSLSKLVVAEVAQLLSCLSEWLPVILLCRLRDSSDGSKEQ